MNGSGGKSVRGCSREPHHALRGCSHDEKAGTVNGQSFVQPLTVVVVWMTRTAPDDPVTGRPDADTGGPTTRRAFNTAHGTGLRHLARRNRTVVKTPSAIGPTMLIARLSGMRLTATSYEILTRMTERLQCNAVSNSLQSGAMSMPGMWSRIAPARLCATVRRT